MFGRKKPRLPNELSAYRADVESVHAYEIRTVDIPGEPALYRSVAFRNERIVWSSEPAPHPSRPFWQALVYVTDACRELMERREENDRVQEVLDALPVEEEGE